MEREMWESEGGFGGGVVEGVGVGLSGLGFRWRTRAGCVEVAERTPEGSRRRCRRGRSSVVGVGVEYVAPMVGQRFEGYGGLGGGDG